MKPMKIGEVSRRSGVSVETIRYYEKEGLLDAPRRRPSGFRQYDESAVARLRFIRRAKELGFTLSEIKDLMGLWRHPDATPADVHERAERKIRDIEEKIRSLQKMKRSLRTLTQQCRHRGSIRECPLWEGMGAGDGEQAE